MLEGLLYLFTVSEERTPWDLARDWLDILIVAYLFYRLLLVLRGTRAMQMGVGFLIFGLLYLIAKHAELSTLLNALSELATWAILIVVVVFQDDIRRALRRVGAKAWLSRGREQRTSVIEEVVAAATELARHRMGAIIALERDANLLEFVKSDGIPMESLVTRELLVSLFIPESLNKTHDGAVLIRDLRIVRAGVFFPMPEDTKVADPSFGSRHRASLGITEKTDAVVVVVSEERGKITLCFNGKHVKDVDPKNLRETLLDLLGHREKQTFRERLRFGRRKATSDSKATADSPKTKRAGAPSSSTPSSGKSTGRVPEPKPSRTGLVAGPPSVRPSQAAMAGSGTTIEIPAASPSASGLDRPEPGLTPVPSRVSKPMPSAKKRKPPADTPSQPDAEPEPPSVRVGESRVSEPGQRSKSRPMPQAEISQSAAAPRASGPRPALGGDEP